MAEYLEIIERDLDRTFPHNDRFSVKGGEAQQELRRVLQALAMANKELGYCQVCYVLSLRRISCVPVMLAKAVITFSY